MTETSIFSVSGMTCAHCVATVTSSLTALPGVSDVDVDLVVGGDSVVRVRSAEPLDRRAVRSALTRAGYSLSSGD